MSNFLELNLYNALFYIITILWVLEFIIFKNKVSNEKKVENNSFYPILISIILIVLLTIFTYNFNILILESSFNNIIKILSLILYTAGIVLKYSSSIFLKNYFTRDIKVSDNQELVSIGPYKYLRHPLYLSLFLLTISVPLFFLNIFIFLFSIILMFYVLNKRMLLEEKLMEEVLGKKYITWKDKRYKFIPFFY